MDEPFACLGTYLALECWAAPVGRALQYVVRREPIDLETPGRRHERPQIRRSQNGDAAQGHSKTPAPHLAELQFHQYPVRFAIDPDGVYVQRIASQHRGALGGRVVRLGQLVVEAALGAVTPTVRYDNEMQIRHHLPTHLVLAELLHAHLAEVLADPAVYAGPLEAS